MTAGTVVITGGILATIILLCIIAVLCYCRLQVSTTSPLYNNNNDIKNDFILSPKLKDLNFISDRIVMLTSGSSVARD